MPVTRSAILMQISIIIAWQVDERVQTKSVHGGGVRSVCRLPVRMRTLNWIEKKEMVSFPLGWCWCDYHFLFFCCPVNLVVLPEPKLPSAIWSRWWWRAVVLANDYNSLLCEVYVREKTLFIIIMMPFMNPHIHRLIPSIHNSIKMHLTLNIRLGESARQLIEWVHWGWEKGTTATQPSK